MSNYFMTTKDLKKMTMKNLKQKCIALKEWIKVMKEEGPALLEEITNNIKQNEILRTTIFHLEELECRVEKLELQLELQANETKFFNSYRDWKRGLTLTQEEQDCINDLKNLLDEKAKMKLCDSVPIDLQVYKPPLEKALKAIDKWRKEKALKAIANLNNQSLY
ncbi:hypothetical protein C1645_835239 [Glomus cerebriforme]|uniref:Uncharacterized protein n=1 Tax=Glomus cerebriforme TaxID=658196 RepID=A0A397SEW1_9GLOM|nr:hypothetical protein C1645_835239 [Glomus cerebriforme]